MSISLAKSLKLQNDKSWSVDFTSNGSQNLLAIGSADRKIKIVNIKAEPRLQFNLVDILDDTVHKKAIRAVAWRPHANILAAGSFDATISIWAREAIEEDVMSNESNIDTEETSEMDLLAIIEGHENEVKCIAWSSDGSLLATCSRDKSVWIWETDEAGEEYECISVLQEHSQDVKHVVWHPAFNILASSSYDDTLRLWRDYDDDWECSAVLNGHEGTVWSSDFEKLADGEYTEENVRLCSGSDDSTVRVWKYTGEDEDGMQEWVCQTVLPKIHTRQVYSVVWGENGLIASTGSDGLLVVYKEVNDGEWEIIAKHELSHGIYEVNNVKWIKVDGLDMLCTAGDDGCVNIWNWNY